MTLSFFVLCFIVLSRFSGIWAWSGITGLLSCKKRSEEVRYSDAISDGNFGSFSTTA